MRRRPVSASTSPPATTRSSASALGAMSSGWTRSRIGVPASSSGSQPRPSPRGRRVDDPPQRVDDRDQVMRPLEDQLLKGGERRQVVTDCRVRDDVIRVAGQCHPRPCGEPTSHILPHSPRLGKARSYNGRRCGPLAQLVEQGTLNPKVEGSIPSRPTRLRIRSASRGKPRFPRGPPSSSHAHGRAGHCCAGARSRLRDGRRRSRPVKAGADTARGLTPALRTRPRGP